MALTHEPPAVQANGGSPSCAASSAARRAFGVGALIGLASTLLAAVAFLNWDVLAPARGAKFSGAARPFMPRFSHAAEQSLRQRGDATSPARAFRAPSPTHLGPAIIQEEPLFHFPLLEDVEKDKASRHALAVAAGVPRDDEAKLEILSGAYTQCEEITAKFSKTFYLGTALMPKGQREAMWTIYAWCRRTDDIVDSPQAMAQGDSQLMAGLSEWRSRLDRLWEGQPGDAFDLALLDTKKKYGLSKEPFLEMIEGMVMDTPAHGKDRYETWKDLELYCYRVASTVGLMALPVLGTAPGVSVEEAKKPAIALGLALQLTNILRDVGEDARERGRIYLPMDDMRRFGVTDTQIFEGVKDENYKKLMKFEIQRARDLYREAQDGIPLLAPSARLSVQAAADMYSQILNKIEDNFYDNFRKRAYTTANSKFLTLIGSWWSVVRMS